jgi:excinuclease ABC subunit C
MDKLKAKLKDIPQSPGVYEFKNKNGEVIYVGKAKNLKARVSQYFTGHDERDQIPYLMEEAADLTYTVVNSELESLFLESTLIKKYLPKYNIMLRDDKNYAFIKIDYSFEIPQIQVVRKVDSPKTYKLKPDTYFGPYTAAYKIRNTLNLIRRIFPFCSAQEVSSRPCFYYYLHRCPGVCIGKISLADYKRHLDKICDFLAGKTHKIQVDLKREMRAASKNRQFETAARLRDQLSALEILEEKQIVILPKKVDWDIVSVFIDHGYACVNLFKVREGKLRDKENFIYIADLQRARDTVIQRVVPPDDRDKSTDTYRSEIFQTFLEKYYLETSSIPHVIYTQLQTEDTELVEHIIRSRFGKKISIMAPQKGKAKELVNLGRLNAEEYLKQWLLARAGHLDKINQALLRLKEILALEKIPGRIEGYDISNIQGTNAVGSMVVFNKGLPAKSEYRKFKIKSRIVSAEGLPKADDFAMMKEVLTRRMSRISNSQFPISNENPKSKISNPKSSWPMPDLIVIDGGKGQLSAALEVLSASRLALSPIPVIGLAKRIEEIFMPGKNESILLDKDDPVLQLLQRLRDEAHRFGVAYHRNLRSKQAVKSALDDIPGIGPKTKKLLKDKFGTVAGIRKASLDELAAIVGERIAQLIQQSL